MTIAISGMSPVKIATTVLAVQDIQFTEGVNYQGFKHSGNEFPSVGVVPGAVPMVSFRTPFFAAYTLIGLKMLYASAFELYFATFASGIRNPGALHTKYALSASANACAYITGASVAQNGLLMANVTVVPLAASATAHPLTPTGTVSLPTLGSEPQLHTLGPISVAGSRIDGVLNAGFSQNIQLATPVNDGDQFPRTVGWLGAEPRLEIQHEDPLTLITALGLLGESIPTTAATAVLCFRGIDPTLQTLQTTGLSLTISSGRIIPGPVSFGLNQTNKMGASIMSLAATTTHPVVVASAVTLP